MNLQNKTNITIQIQINFFFKKREIEVKISKKHLQISNSYLRPLSLKSLSSEIRAFNRLRNDIVEGYCSLLASISFSSNCISYTCNIHESFNIYMHIGEVNFPAKLAT